MISASLSWSLPSAGWKSTSTPRSWKIWTAASDSASEMRTLGAWWCPVSLALTTAPSAGFGGARPSPGEEEARVASPRGERIATRPVRVIARARSVQVSAVELALALEGPVEPGRQRLDVGRLDGGAAPDAQARRGVAIGADVVGDAFASPAAEVIALAKAAAASARQRGDGGVDDLEADRGVGAGRRVRGEELDPGRCSVDPVCQHRRGWRRRGRSGPSRPPTAFAQSSASMSSSTPSIEGVLMVSPSKMPSISLPPVVRRKIFGSGQAGV